MDEFIAKHVADMNFRVADIETALRCAIMSAASRAAVERELASARKWRDIVAEQARRRREAKCGERLQ
jgi:hypothetical protein